MSSPNPVGSLNSVVTSRNMIPGFGKSGMVRIFAWIDMECILAYAADRNPHRLHGCLIQSTCANPRIVKAACGNG